MTLDLSAEREYVRSILAGLNLGEAYGYIPSRTSLPAFLVVPEDPYLSSGQTFGTAVIHLQVAYVSDQGANSNQSDQCDAAVSAAVNALLADDARISSDSGSAPYALTLNGNQYVAQNLTISFTINL